MAYLVVAQIAHAYAGQPIRGKTSGVVSMGSQTGDIQSVEAQLAEVLRHREVLAHGQVCTRVRPAFGLVEKLWAPKWVTWPKAGAPWCTPGPCARTSRWRSTSAKLRFDGLNVASWLPMLTTPEVFPLIGWPAYACAICATTRYAWAAIWRVRFSRVRARFSPERWQDFKRDMKVLRRHHGRGGTTWPACKEHGGDATPAWILPAYLLFSHLPAKEWTLTATGLIDPC